MFIPPRHGDLMIVDHFLIIFIAQCMSRSLASQGDIDALFKGAYFLPFATEGESGQGNVRRFRKRITRPLLKFARRQAVSGTSNQASANSNPGCPVPLMDVNRGNEPHLATIMEKLEQICRSGQFIGGPHCKELESSLAELCQAKFAIGCASGSDALLLALMAIDLQPGDEIIVPSFTFFASVSAITRLGGTPVFIDIEPATFNMNARLLRGLITSRTRAIMPVHLFGQCCDMDAIRSIAVEFGLHVIEDAAQAIGASFNGEMAGGMGSLGCISFYPTKNLGGFGDAGLVTCNDPVLADRVRLLANHGMQPRYYHQAIGINSRLDAMQAAVLCTKLPSLRLYAAARERNARTYEQELRAAGLAESIVTPFSDSRCEHVWNQFTVRISGGRRDAVRAALSARGVGSEVYYPVPMHQQKCFSHIACDPDSLPETERAAAEVLSLPIFPELTRQELKLAVTHLIEIVGSEKSFRRAA